MFLLVYILQFVMFQTVQFSSEVLHEVCFLFFFFMDEQVFSVLLFGSHICSYSTTEKYYKNGEMWAW